MANEKRLIDVNVLLDLLRPLEGVSQIIKKVLAIIRSCPTVDAVEVVHGRWVIQRYYGGMRKGVVSRVVCSECYYPNEETNYCPNCGAKMDGERKSNGKTE